MNRRALIFRAFLVLAAIWVAVAGVRAVAAARLPSAGNLERLIAKAGFADWSGGEPADAAAVAARRERALRGIAGMFNRLDFRERERVREAGVSDELLPKLTPKEKRLFVDLTVGESLNRMMEALDALPASERRRFLKQGMEEMLDGGAGRGGRQAKGLGDELVAKVAEQGMRAYFQGASVDTKLDLAPLMEVMNEVMQGLRGNEFGPPRHHHQ